MVFICFCIFAARFSHGFRTSFIQFSWFSHVYVYFCFNGPRIPLPSFSPIENMHLHGLHLFFRLCWPHLSHVSTSLSHIFRTTRTFMSCIFASMGRGMLRRIYFILYAVVQLCACASGTVVLKGVSIVIPLLFSFVFHRSLPSET